jgi:hypothetical protein
MKKAILFLFFVLPILGFCQSFVFCPQIKTDVNQGFENVKVSIVFDDSRTYEKKLKEKCTKNEIFQEFSQYIKRTFPKMQLTTLDESMFYKDPLKENMTIQVKFQKYDATFKTAVYHANTKFNVKIYFYTDKENIIEQTFEGTGSMFNALGYGSCKSALNTSFKEAFDKFVLFLSEVAKSAINLKTTDQILPQKFENSKSKADRLRELKQLLDEKILTQEEYEIEKKKILEEKG